MSGAGIQAIAVCAAFWTALALHDREAPRRTPRFAASLVLGAALTHLGWAACFGSESSSNGRSASSEWGASVLFLPLGPLGLAPWPAAFAALPLALAVARGGCLAAGCCAGRDGEPLGALEIGAWLVLRRVLCRLPERSRVAAFLVAFGAIRLAQQPWRGPPSGDDPAFELAMGWLLVGLLGASRSGPGVGIVEIGPRSSPGGPRRVSSPRVG